MTDEARVITLSEGEREQPDLSRRRSIPWSRYLVIVGGVVAGVAAASWWWSASTVSMEEYEAAASGLSVAEAELADSSSQIAVFTAENSELRLEVESLSGEIAGLQAELADLRSESERVRQELPSLTATARAFAALVLNYDPDFLAELRGVGLDESIATELLADMGIDEPYGEWLERNAWTDTDRILMQVPDDGFQQSWDTYAASEFGSPEETVAFVDSTWRLARLLLQSVARLPTEPAP